MKKRSILGVLAATLMAGAAPSLAADVVPATGAVKPLYGNINPFYRDISAFWGNINPFYGDISAFWGNINPFYGDISAFWGNINPFYGDISAFYGNINPFWGNINPFTGDIKAHYGNISAFWGNINPFWGDINAFWGDIIAFNNGSLNTLDGKLEDFVIKSESFWGAAVQAKTGKSFREGFAQPLFQKYGMSLDDPSTFYGKTAAQRSEFMLAWYDQLMEFSGMDHTDHWMKTINWTPAITQQQGEGFDAVVGLIDFTIAGDSDIQSKLSYFNGTSTFSNGHGAGVASLMVGAHDGKGVMGIAPNASVVAYNPFDATGSTNFGEVLKGLQTILPKTPSVINMSLGVPGWTFHGDWNTVFRDATVTVASKKTVYVVAAGNEGLTQTANITWTPTLDPALIIVGSVDPNGVISTFSNRPGTACMVKADGKCEPNAKLMNHFVVAPGELILVSDDKGGVVRQSGTSLAAPLVTGTVALLHDRWPWLVNFPNATAEIIFRSAKDLGAPGVDPVYGWGLLDVAAAQSVLDFSKLKYYQSTNTTTTSTAGLRAISAGDVVKAGINPLWEASGAFFIVFENTATTQRDFAIPLSSRLYGQNLGGNLFQQFVYERLVEWIKSGGVNKTGGFAAGAGFGGAGFAAANETVVSTPLSDGTELAFGFSSRQEGLFGTPSSEFALRYADPEEGYSYTIGYGRGAAALGFHAGFDLSSDYEAGAGVNPILGFASGGAYAQAAFYLGDGFTLSAGATRTGEELVPDTYGEEASPTDLGFDDYRAGAVTMSLSYKASDTVNLRLSYTELAEENGILGVAALQDDFSSDTVTDGVTVGADVNLGNGFTFGAAATFGRTRSSGNDLAVVDPALSTSFEFALAKTGVFGEYDRARVSFGQPLHVEAGTLSYTQIGVVNRLTGELGPVTQEFTIGGGTRRFNGELLYATPFMDGRGEFGAFAKATVADDAFQTSVEDYTAGVSFRFAF